MPKPKPAAKRTHDDDGAAGAPPRSTFREYLEALVVAGIFLAFSNTFVLKTFYIPSGSMEDTLLVGDHLFVNRFIFGHENLPVLGSLMPVREPRRGDIVIFRSPETPELDLVKRCIGMPGDEVRMVDKVLYLNGDRVDDSSFTQHLDPRVFPERARNGRPITTRDNFGPITIAEEEYFCLGDNRDHSHDSRFWGTVPRANIKGRALIIYWSFGGETSDGTWRGWGPRIKQLGKTVVGFVTKSRWKRTLHLIR